MVAICAVTVGTVVAPSPAQAAVGGTIKVSGSLNVRSAATTSSKVVGKLRNKARISIDCQVVGQSVKGDVRRTTLWNRLTNGRYVSHAYVVSGAIRRCPPPPKPKPKPKPAPAPAPSPAGTNAKIKVAGSVNVRSGPSTASNVVGTFADNAPIKVSCQIEGDYIKGDVRGSSMWDRLSDGRFVSHAYVVSGSFAVCADAPAPTMTNAQFIAASVPGAQRGWREFGVPASVTIGQAILESGWGRSKLSANDRNYFGIKCFGTPGPIAAGCRTYRTTECDKAGKCFTTSATFRTYSSMTDSYRDHGSFLKANSRYAASFNVNRDANKFIYSIWKAGYATDPAYYTKMTGIMKTYNLYQYDIWR
ncbi:sporangiospore maturation cell wall hydrolase GsmA [Micromonospora sp. NPDC049679]|uniref:sporangiospore maturation cell wall hydrolase GsmA n=1 Tax=Micromonospora sp. NPDC049679 TaxID=3155920 RepID=UPI0033E0E5B5